MAKKKTEKVTLAVLIDESGSMGGNQQSVCDSYNEFIADLKGSDEATDKDVRVSLATFDSAPGEPKVRVKFDGEKLAAVREISTADYQPRGGTPLNDALLMTIESVEKTKCDRALVTIITDGQENSSEASTNDVKKVVDSYEEKGWRFIYMGANVDSWAESGARGMQVNSTYAFTSSPEGTRRTAGAMSARSSSYLSADASNLRGTYDAEADEEFAKTGNVIPEAEEADPQRAAMLRKANEENQNALKVDAEAKQAEARREAKKRNAKTGRDASEKVKNLL